MNTVDTTQRNATRNQSTADFQRKSIFTFGNRFSEAIFKNDSGALLVATAGILVRRDTANPTKVIPVTALTLADTIGILAIEGEVEMAIAADINCNYCIEGDIDGEFLVLPAGVTLNTVVGNKILKDILTDLDFVINNVVDGSKFDN